MWVAVLLICAEPGDCRMFTKKQPFANSVECLSVLGAEIQKYNNKTFYLIGGDCFKIEVFGEET